MSKITDAAVYSTVTTLVTATALVIVRDLLRSPIPTAELLIVIAAVWPINFATQLILKRRPKPSLE